jgi:hypothetical protein
MPSDKGGAKSFEIIKKCEILTRELVENNTSEIENGLYSDDKSLQEFLESPLEVDILESYCCSPEIKNSI